MVSSVVSLLDYIYLRFHLHPHHTIFSSCHGRFLLAGLDSHLALVGIPLSAYLSARLGVAPRVTLEIQPVLLETRGRHLFVCLVCHGRERERERKKERKKERVLTVSRIPMIFEWQAVLFENIQCSICDIHLPFTVRWPYLTINSPLK